MVAHRVGRAALSAARGPAIAGVGRTAFGSRRPGRYRHSGLHAVPYGGCELDPRLRHRRARPRVVRSQPKHRDRRIPVPAASLARALHRQMVLQRGHRGGRLRRLGYRVERLRRVRAVARAHRLRRGIALAFTRDLRNSHRRRHGRRWQSILPPRRGREDERATGAHSLRRVIVVKRFVLAMIVVLLPTVGFAQDTQYWNLQYGTRGELLGGVVVGSALDMSATFYNPAAIVFVEDPSFILTASVFGMQTIKLLDQDPDEESVDTRTFGPLPSMFAGVLPMKWFGGRTAYYFLTRQELNFRLLGCDCMMIGVD